MAHDVSYTSCEQCGALLTDRYVSKYGKVCPDCQRELGSKLWYVFYGPGRVPIRYDD